MFEEHFRRPCYPTEDQSLARVLLRDVMHLVGVMLDELNGASACESTKDRSEAVCILPQTTHSLGNPYSLCGLKNLPEFSLKEIWCARRESNSDLGFRRPS
jgi:hypothetical protein